MTSVNGETHSKICESRSISDEMLSCSNELLLFPETMLMNDKINTTECFLTPPGILIDAHDSSTKGSVGSSEKATNVSSSQEINIRGLQCADYS